MRIFVTVGNALVHFERMLRMVDEAQVSLPCEGICQHGVSSFHPRGLTPRPTMSRSEFDAAVRGADSVICHAGVGTLWSAIEAGHIPLVIPRRKGFGEVVNDHQLDICRALEQTGRIRVIADTQQLLDGLRATAARTSATPRAPLVRDLSRLAPIARAVEELQCIVPAPMNRAGSALLGLLAAFGPPIDRLRVKT